MALVPRRATAASSAARVVRRLSAEDLSILALESETVAGHTCKVIVLGGEVDVDRVRAAVASRLHEVPELSMRLSEIGGELWWTLDQEVDPRAHVVACNESRPPDQETLGTAVAGIFVQRLDRSRPLWRIDVIPRLADGGGALIWRIHHALADGMTAMRMAGTALWDAQPEGGSLAPGARTRPPAARQTADGHHHLDGLHVIAREAPHPWHGSPFDGHVGSRRSVAFASVELDGLRRAAAATDGATVNDAVLSVVAGGLRRWLETHHGRLGQVRVKVPVSLHGPPVAPGPAGDATGNRDSFFCLDLPLGSSDPVDRLASIRRATRARKDGHDAQELDTLMRGLARTPRLRSFAERVLAHPRSFALNVSNVPGPRHPINVLGVPVHALYSLAEIRERHALRIAVVSHAGTLNFGLTADPTLLDDVDHLAKSIRAEAAALASIVRPRAPGEPARLLPKR